MMSLGQVPHEIITENLLFVDIYIRIAIICVVFQHKGYGLSLIDELYAAYTGGSLPTIRNR